MCTVSWLSLADGFELYFSRDESRVRARGERPRLSTGASGVRYLAPRDPNAGGTWIMVNELGAAACLLNRYPRDGSVRPSPAGSSRGNVVRALTQVRNVTEAEERLRAMELATYQPFTVLALDAGAGVRLMAWDGNGLTFDTDPTSPLASSGHSSATVEAVRRQVWAAMSGPDDEDRSARLLAFHQSHLPKRGALSPCMHRMRAHTVSLCQIKVSVRRVMMAYAAGAPCRTPLAPPVALARAGRRAFA